MVDTEFAANPDSAVIEAFSYFELEDGHRLDVVGLDTDGNVRVTLEVERSNHDILRAVPDDYDKMAAFDPAEAIWIVENREGAHDVLGALNDPPTGGPRVTKTSSESTPPQTFSLDGPGCTDIHTFRYVRDTIQDLEPPE